MIQANDPPLGEDTGTRILTVSVKGALGVIPGIGGLLAEVAGQFIPQQRIDRLEAYVKHLTERLDATPLPDLEERLTDPDRVDLFEEGALQSARALSPERQVYIATVVAGGMTGDEKDRIEAKRMLKLLREVDDDQIIILVSKLHRHTWDEDYFERHAAVLEPVVAHMGSDRAEFDRQALFQLARAELLRLGLLAPTFKSVKKGEMPEFDPATGTIKQQSPKLTPLARLLLRHIGLATDDEL